MVEAHKQALESIHKYWGHQLEQCGVTELVTLAYFHLLHVFCGHVFIVPVEL